MFAPVLNFIILCTVFVGSITASASQTFAQDVVQKIEGHADTASWCLQESTGRIFATVKSAGLVVEYDSNGKEINQFAVAGEPVEMIVKGDWLVVGCTRQPQFSIIDLNQNKVTGSVQLVGQGPYALFCSKVDNPFVYGICNTGDAWWDGEIFQVDLANQKVRNRVKVQQWGQSHPVHVAMSSDGSWIVPDARGVSSPSGADLMRVDEETCEFTQKFDHHDSFGQIIAGPANRFWTLGNQLYPLNLDKPVRKFTGTPVAIHPRFDLVASYAPTAIHLERFSDGKLLKTLPLESADKKSSGSKRSRSVDKKKNVCLKFDLANSRLIAGSGTNCHVIELGDLNIDFQPMLMISAPSTLSAVVNDSIEIPLSVTNLDLLAKTNFELVNSPNGTKLDSKRISWKPSSAQIGNFEIVVNAIVGERKDTHTVSISVESPKIELDFHIHGFEISHSGKFAIAWGKKIVKDQPQSPRPNSGGADEVAIINLDERKIVIQKTMPAGIRTALVDGEFAFIAPNSGNVLYRMDRDTLGDSKRQFLNKSPSRLIRRSANEIGIVTGGYSHESALQIFDRATFKPISNASPNTRYHFGSNGTPYQQVGPEQMSMPGKIVHLGNGQTVAVTNPLGIPSFISTSNRADATPPMMGKVSGNKIYGRYVTGNRIVNYAGSAVTTLNGTGHISTHAPLLFSLRHENNRRGRVNENKLFLETRNLVDGNVIDSRLVDVDTGQNNRSIHSNSQMQQIFPQKDRVILLRANNVFVVPLSEDTIADVPVPLHFPWRKLDLLDVDKPQKIKVSAKGGNGKIEYSLVNEYEGIDLNPATGEIELDTPSMWKAFLATGPQSTTSARAMSRSQPDGGNLTDSYQAIMGEPLPKDKLVFALPIQLNATDEEGQIDQISFYVLTLAPKKELDEKVEAAQAEMAQRRAEMQRQREKQMAEAEAMLEKQRAEAASDNDGKGDSKPDRIGELEKRMRRMEATLDAILQKLERLDKSGGDRDK